MCAGSHGAEKFCFNTQRKHSFQRKHLKTPDGVDKFKGQNFAAGEKKNNAGTALNFLVKDCNPHRAAS